MMRCSTLVALVAGLVATAGPLSAEKDDAADSLAILGESGADALHSFLMRTMREQYDARRAALARAVRSPADALARRDALLAEFRELLGPFPPRTPLQPRTTGTIECDGYRIEKIIYESRPGHRVTANLYVPTTSRGPFPGVLVPCGHSTNGKAERAYQSACVLLAKNEIVALIYDPISQGERHQLLDSPRHGTTTHSLLGIGALLVGLNTGHYRTWDGIRSLDYLASRPEVDSRRLGCTGNSGGGTMTTWLMAVDPRIAAAAPSCFITSIERVFATLGSQDCEQLFPRLGLLGIEHSDFLMMRAPRPTLICAAERDFFDIRGTREGFVEAKAFYGTLGSAGNVDLFTFDDNHGFSRPRRQAAVAWMRRWLADDLRPVHEPTLDLQSDEALQVTETGQVAERESEVTVQSLNLARARALADERRRFLARPLAEIRARIRSLLGITRKARPKTDITGQGSIDRDGIRMEKRLVDTGEVPLPLVRIRSRDHAPKTTVVYVDDRGFAYAARPGGEIESLAREGADVFAVDLRGYGETRDRGSPPKYHNPEFRTAMLAMHIGRPLFGQRVEDLLDVVDHVTREHRAEGTVLHVIGAGHAGAIALHAAVLDERIERVSARESISSWIDDVVARPLAPNLMGTVVPGALEFYDLPDLVELLGERMSAD